MKLKIRYHHLDHNNHERHSIILDDNDNDVYMIMMDYHEDISITSSSDNKHINENTVEQVTKEEDEDIIRHSSIELSSSVHDDSSNRNKIISSCSISKDDDSYDISSSSSSCCSYCSNSSVVSSTNSNSSFGKYTDDNDTYCNNLLENKTIENWIDVDISSTCDDDDNDDDITETSYCSSTSASSWYDDDYYYSNLSSADHDHDHNHKEEEIKNRIDNKSSLSNEVTIICEDSLVLLDHRSCREQSSFGKKNKQQKQNNDVPMKQPWRTKTTTNNRMIIDVNNVTTNCSPVLIIDDHYDNDRIICERKKVVIMDRKQLRVTFDSNIYVREYNVTVGAYASVNDTCPLQLTWEHTPIQIIPFNNEQKEKHTITNNSNACYQSQSLVPHRMNIKERRQRIATLNHISVYDVYMLEQQSIFCQIQEAIHNNHQIMIHNLNFQDNNDRDDINCNTNNSTLSFKDVIWHKNSNNVWHKNNNNNTINSNISRTNNINNMKINHHKGGIATKYHIGQDNKNLKQNKNNLNHNAKNRFSSSSSHNNSIQHCSPPTKPIRNNATTSNN